MADFTTVEIALIRELLTKQTELLSVAEKEAALSVVAGAGQETILDLNEATAASVHQDDKTVIERHDGSATESIKFSDVVSYVSGQIGGGGTDFNKQGHFKWVAGGGDGGAGYKLKDIVYHSGNTYISTANNNTTEPGTVSANWEVYYGSDTHDPTRNDYKMGARVQNGFGGDWYEAVQDVPVNTLITNTTYWLPFRTQNRLVKYFTTTPTTNVGVSIFVEGQGQMHWDATTSSYKKDFYHDHDSLLKQTITYRWRYDLQKYHKTISMRATADNLGSVNVIFPVAFDLYVSDPKLTDIANAAGSSFVGAFAHSSSVSLTGFSAYCNFNSASAGAFSIFVEGV